MENPELIQEPIINQGVVSLQLLWYNLLYKSAFDQRTLGMTEHSIITEIWPYVNVSLVKQFMFSC